MSPASLFPVDSLLTHRTMPQAPYRLSFRGKWIWASGDFESRKMAAKKIFPNLVVNKAERLEHFSDCMINSRYPERSENSQSTSQTNKPIHNWTSHFRSAFEYYAVNVAHSGDFEVVRDEDNTLTRFY